MIRVVSLAYKAGVDATTVCGSSVFTNPAKHVLISRTGSFLGRVRWSSLLNGPGLKNSSVNIVRCYGFSSGSAARTAKASSFCGRGGVLTKHRLSRSHHHQTGDNSRSGSGLFANRNIISFAGFSRGFRSGRSSQQKTTPPGSQNVAKTDVANAKPKLAALPPAKDLRRLLQLARPERRRVAAAIGLLLISSAVTMAVPYSMGRVIDTIYSAVEQGNVMDNLKWICKILVVVFIVGGCANAGRVYLMQMSGQRIVNRLRNAVFGSIMKQETAFFDKTRTGELINRLSADTALVGYAVTENISDGLRSTVAVVAGVGMMFYVSPQLASIVLTVVPPISMIGILYGRYVRKITKRVQDALAKSTEVAEEKIGNIRTVKAFAKEDNECERYAEKIATVVNLAKQESLAKAAFFGSMGMAGNLVVLSVLYGGGMMMESAHITVGDLSAFLMYTGWVAMSLGGLTSFYSELMKAIGATSRLWELVDRKPEIAIDVGHIPTAASVLGAIKFNDIHFAYPSRLDVQVFSNLDLSVPAGSVTAVVGSSGSGKSTLGSLLLRLYDPNQGSVTIDGEDIRNLNPQWLRTYVGTVSQEPILFSCSIRDNITYGAAEPAAVSMDKIIQAAQEANALDFILSFPDGFDTVVGERGVMLSGGQRQRIAIARALIKDPRILLLDEATSALDAESESLVQEALERLMIGRTVITIAHRLSTIKNADTIAVLHNGGIVERGSYESLMAIPSGMFRKLVEKQTIVAR
ncbi:ATP-binding cassette sub-family B member 10, mitochondrial-like [Branchiostoma floridae x Branchiostoma belcheri]